MRNEPINPSQLWIDWLAPTALNHYGANSPQLATFENRGARKMLPYLRSLIPSPLAAGELVRKAGLYYRPALQPPVKAQKVKALASEY